MSNENKPPPHNLSELTRAPQRRSREIERRTIKTGSALDVPGGDRFPGFSFPLFTVGDLAPRWYSTRAISYVAARISCQGAGGGTGSFDLDLNGSTVLTLSLLTGEFTHLYTAVFSMSAGSYLAGEVTAASGQAVVSVQLEEAA